MNTKTVDYLNGKLFSMILKFSVPVAVSLLITAVYNIVDRMFAGNFNGTSALAGLSVCFPLPFMMMAFALMCSAGGSTFFSLFSGLLFKGVWRYPDRLSLCPFLLSDRGLRMPLPGAVPTVL